MDQCLVDLLVFLGFKWVFGWTFFTGDGFYLAIGGGIGQHSWCHIQNIIHDKQYNVKLEDNSEKMGMLSIQGPKRSVRTVNDVINGVLPHAK